jgi:hypothetical protein
MDKDVRLRMIVSGGQTGVDRAALDAAMARGMEVGGWCPHGRPAEDGIIDPRYPLRETPSGQNAQRTEWNVRDSDGTLVLYRGEPDNGTSLTLDLAGRLGKPYLVADLRGADSDSVREWVRRHGLKVLNIAGPRESSSPGIYEEALRFVRKVLAGTRT